ncbi:MAG: fumarylacetoacetate hydrolase family protein [Oceanococcaceae bacterium]
MLTALRMHDGGRGPYAPGKIICVAKNYAAHAAELDSSVPAEPTFFLKPNSALCDFSGPLQLPSDRGDVHHEIELALLIGRRVTRPENADRSVIAGYALAIDLTLRSLQTRLREQGYPWEAAKAFVGACPLAPVLPVEALADPQDVRIGLAVNGVTRQDDTTRSMVYGIDRLLADATRLFGLEAGDLLLTGTPVGVGELKPGDQYTGWIGDFRYDGTVAG